MSPFHGPVRRILIAGGFAAAIVAAPMIVTLSMPDIAPTAPYLACPAGESEDLFTDMCVPEMSPNQPGGISYSNAGNEPGVPEVEGVPCTGRNTGECIGLEEEQQTIPTQPHSTISPSN
jgi:hypothetical protein